MEAFKIVHETLKRKFNITSVKNITLFLQSNLTLVLVVVLWQSNTPNR